MEEEKVKRIYVDTSIVIGRFDADESRKRKTELFWEAVQCGEVIAIVSDVEGKKGCRKTRCDQAEV